MNNDLIKLVNEIKRRREIAFNWQCNADNQVERLISINQNAGREEALYNLLCWIENNIELPTN